MNCMALGLTLFTQVEGVELTQLQIEEQVIALAWERSQPLKDVRKAIDSGTAWDAIDEFADSLPPTAYARIVSEINRVAQEIAAHAVEIVPRSGVEDKDAPGN